MNEFMLLMRRMRTNKAATFITKERVAALTCNHLLCESGRARESEPRLRQLTRSINSLSFLAPHRVCVRGIYSINMDDAG